MVKGLGVFGFGAQMNIRLKGIILRMKSIDCIHVHVVTCHDETNS